MACACKVNKDLTYLQRKYGTSGPKSGETRITDNVLYIIKDMITALLMILLIPFVVVYLVITSTKNGGVIKITDLIGFRKLKKVNV